LENAKPSHASPVKHEAKHFRSYLMGVRDKLLEDIKALKLKRSETDLNSNLDEATWGNTMDLENWQEAISHIYHVYTPHTVPASITELFGHPILQGDVENDHHGALHSPCEKLPCPVMSLMQTQSSHGATWPPVFWSLVSGLKSFVSDYKRLPLSGVVPDMKADTKTYIELQQM
jgi:amyloid beta precursor protein binding protein 1